MFYKIDENGEWFTAMEIYFPDGAVFNSPTEEMKQGWYWSDSEPEEYTAWKELKENPLINKN